MARTGLLPGLDDFPLTVTASGLPPQLSEQIVREERLFVAIFAGVSGVRRGVSGGHEPCLAAASAASVNRDLGWQQHWMTGDSSRPATVDYQHGIGERFQRRMNRMRGLVVAIAALLRCQWLTWRRKKAAGSAPH